MTNGGLRVLWTVIGLVLTAIGVAGLVASLGALPGLDAGAPLIWSGLLNLWRDISPWGLVVVALIGLLLAGLGFSLLRRQLRPRRGPAMGDLDLQSVAGRTPGGGQQLPGATRVRGVRLARGLERDLARDPLVRKASVTLVGPAPQPDLRIELQLSPRARLAAIHDHVDAAVDRFRTTSGLRPRHLDITARIDNSGPARVR